VPLVTRTSPAPAVAAPAASGSVDDDLIAEIARQTNVLINLYNLLTGQRDDHRKSSSDLKAKLTDINNAQVKKAI
jgi:sensor domain CHASE-containing protein